MQRFLDSLCQHVLATPLAIWGKLPSHGDYLRHRTTSAQARDWQDWVGRVWSQRGAAQETRAPQRVRPGEPGWISLEPRKVAVNLVDVPVAFLMQPGSLPFSPRHCVQGVVLASEDQVGRPCPLIIFQQIAPHWQRRTWSGAVTPGHQDILFWLSRLAARAHVAERSWDELTQTVDGIWQAHAPNWRHVLGAPPVPAAQEQLGSLLNRYCAHSTADTARGLQGVQRLPWAHGPAYRWRSGGPAQAFWQQDLRGGYVSAGESLRDLWGART